MSADARDTVKSPASPLPDDTHPFPKILHQWGCTRRSYSKGDIIFTQGEAADSVYYVLEGAVKLSAVSPQGKEGVIALLERQSFFGERCLSQGMSRLFTATAFTDTRLIRCERDSFFELFSGNSDFCIRFVTHLIDRLFKTQYEIMDHISKPAQDRLPTLLLSLAGFSNGEETICVGKIDQQTLANMVGTTRSRVNYFMQQLRKQGHIRYADGLWVNTSLRTLIADEGSAEFTRPAVSDEHT